LLISYKARNNEFSSVIRVHSVNVYYASIDDNASNDAKRKGVRKGEEEGERE